MFMQSGFLTVPASELKKEHSYSKWWMMYYSLPGEDSNKLAPSMHPAISMIMTCDLYISDIPKLKLCTCCILFLASYSRRFDNIHVAAAANFRIAALATTSTWTIVQQLQAVAWWIRSGSTGTRLGALYDVYLYSARALESLNIHLLSC